MEYRKGDANLCLKHLEVESYCPERAEGSIFAPREIF